jgi:GTP-binding protein
MVDQSPLDTLSPQDIEWGRWLFTQECQFVFGVQKLDQLGDFSLPEVAFVGRSNVGKSSLINALTGRKQLARTSHTPGRTQQLNFFDLGRKLLLVDMPGYGFARVSKSTLQLWRELIEYYLRGRPTLKRVYLLIDSRHGLKESDQQLMKMLDKTAVSYQIVLTKCDKSSQKQAEELVIKLKDLLLAHPAAHPTPLKTSAAEQTGIELLRAEIAKFALKEDV